MHANLRLIPAHFQCKWHRCTHSHPSFAAGKEPGQNKKPIFLTSPLDLLQLYSNAGAQDDTPKVNSGRRASTPLSTASSTISLVAEGIVTQSNESLRWNGILDDPVAEEERLSSYRLNRRQRYNACLQKSLPPEPSLTLKHLPQLCKVAHLKGEQTSGKSKPSDSLSVANKNQNYSPNSKLMTKT